MIYSTLIGMQQREQGKELEIKREMYHIKPKTDRLLTPVTEITDNHKIKRKSRNKLIKLFIILLISPLLVYGGITAINKFKSNKKAYEIPTSITDKVSFPLYAPALLPDNYKIEESSFSATSDVLTYYASNPEGKKINFSIQPLPSNFNFEIFYKNFQESSMIQTNNGEGIVGQLYKAWTVSIKADSWIIIRMDGNNQKDNLIFVAENLQKI